MVLTMNLPHTMVEFYDVFEETLQALGMTEEIEKMKEHISEKRRPIDFLKELILSIGFNIRTINVDGFKMKYCDGSAFLNHSFIRNNFMAPWKSCLPEKQAEQVFTIIEQKLNAISLEKGELVMSIPYVCFDCFK
jgi:hypothetical protein